MRYIDTFILVLMDSSGNKRNLWEVASQGFDPVPQKKQKFDRYEDYSKSLGKVESAHLE